MELRSKRSTALVRSFKLKADDVLSSNKSCATTSQSLFKVPKSTKSWQIVSFSSESDFETSHSVSYKKRRCCNRQRKRVVTSYKASGSLRSVLSSVDGLSSSDDDSVKPKESFPNKRIKKLPKRRDKKRLTTTAELNSFFEVDSEKENSPEVPRCASSVVQTSAMFASRLPFTTCDKFDESSRSRFGFRSIRDSEQPTSLFDISHNVNQQTMSIVEEVLVCETPVQSKCSDDILWPCSRQSCIHVIPESTKKTRGRRLKY